MKLSPRRNPLFSWQRLAASLIVGFSLGFFAYILFLQTPVLSRRYLLLGFAFAIAASAIAYSLLGQHPFALKNGYFFRWRPLLFAGLLFSLVLPSYLFWPPYPELPFFQHQSSLIISVRTGAEPVAWSQFRRIYLNSGVEKLGFRGFQISGPWIVQGEDYILLPESLGQITWQGRVGRRASFALPIPARHLEITTDWDGEVREVPVDKSPYVRNKSFHPPVWYAGLIYAITWIPLFFSIVLMDGFPWLRRVALPALIVVLALAQTNLQFQMLAEEFHRPLQEAIKTVQFFRHYAVLSGSAPNPWQFRVFSEWILESFIYVFSRGLRLENAIDVSLFSLRVLQNAVLLALAYLYFVRLGITKTISVFGVFLLAGGMMHAFYQSDLSFNTYFDVIFFLLGGILILEGKYGWLPALMVPAALNRETSALIPILLVAWGMWGKPGDRARALVSGGLGFLIWVLVFVALHLYYPDAPMFRVGDELLPGWKLFRYNFTVPEMPILLFQTLGFLPLVGLLAYKYWSLFVRIGFLLLVPAWILVHAFSSVWAETRLFLVLSAMVFVPAVLPLVDLAFQGIRQPVITENPRPGERLRTRP